ncbi:MAG: hypothetical protein WA635_03790, partial [Gallionella sp.]
FYFRVDAMNLDTEKRLFAEFCFVPIAEVRRRILIGSPIRIRTSLKMHRPFSRKSKRGLTKPANQE